VSPLGYSTKCLGIHNSSLFDVVQQIVVGMVGEDDSFLLIMNKCKWESLC
jgi:hypothetical protein